MILSALLSAVTGAFAGGRPAEARLHHPAAAQSVAMAVPTAEVAAPAIRPAQANPARPARPFAAPVPVAPLPAAPIETDRLRE
ncbi:hypothetical protein [Allosphingosinicella sp.]|uniref:hypothetical protein n=1 Tax=Allosphingosinicella sp. TaxID=2823234 RepID=UPI003782D394